MDDSGPQGQVGTAHLDALKAPSPSMQLTGPCILMSPCRSMFCFLVSEMGNLVTNSSRVCMSLSSHLVRVSTDLIPNSFERDFGQATSQLRTLGGSHGTPVTL